MLAKHVVGEPDPGRPGVRTMLDARRLIVLREVARRGSFSAAAHALWITQPAVSRQIAALERELGRKVLERTPRGLRLTDAGSLLVEHAEAIVARLAAAEAQLGTLDRLESGRLRLGSAGTVSAALLASAMAEFRRRWPSVELSLHELETDDPSAPVKGGELDLAIAFESGIAPRALDPELDTVRLLDDPLLLALPTSHPLSGRDQRRPARPGPRDVDPGPAGGTGRRARRLRRGGVRAGGALRRAHRGGGARARRRRARSRVRLVPVRNDRMAGRRPPRPRPPRARAPGRRDRAAGGVPAARRGRDGGARPRRE